MSEGRRTGRGDGRGAEAGGNVELGIDGPDGASEAADELGVGCLQRAGRSDLKLGLRSAVATGYTGCTAPTGLTEEFTRTEAEVVVGGGRICKETRS